MDIKSKINIGKIDEGKILLWLDRLFWYFGKISMMVTMFGVLKLLGLTWFWLIFLVMGLIPVAILIVYLDQTYVFPKFQKHIWNKNPVVKQLLEK